MITDMNTNKFPSIVKELSGRKLSISPLLNTKSYFPVSKDVRLNSAHYLIMKIHNRKELQNTAINYSTAIGDKEFIKIYGKYKKSHTSFLTTCYYHVTHTPQSESTLYSCLNVKELLA